MVSKILLVIFFLLIIPSSGCCRYLADRLIKAPNYGKAKEQLGELTEDRMKYLQIDHQMRVDVGPPDASLHIAIIEPKIEWEVTPGTLWYGNVRGLFEKIAAEHPDSTVPEILYWRKYPDSNDSDPAGFTFTTKPSEPNLIELVTKGTIICLPGIRMSKDILVATWGQVLAAHGYKMVLIDLRGQGKSTGDMITLGSVETRDLLQVIDCLEAEGIIKGRLILMGGSYGAAIAINAAQADERIEAVIAMEPYSSLTEAAWSFARTEFGFWAWLFGKSCIEKSIEIAGSIAGFKPEDIAPVKAITKSKTPVLLIHGLQDEHIPYQHSIRLNKAAPDHTKLVLVDGSDHLTLPFHKIYPIRDEIINWLEETP
ncbi:MAG: alpha/beta fold hydrolase [Sedimentisphaerales bacterium]|nr:alpha/beta fold hydrolase [Sedimentisphaerales bacterium]